MNSLDIILALFLTFGFIKGLFKGLFVEVASLLALILGIYGAIHFSDFVGNYLYDLLDWNKKYVGLTSFIITFILIVIAITLLGKFFTKLADFASLGLLNSLLGGVFGILKIALVLSVLLMFFNKFNTKIKLVDESTLNESILYTPIKESAVLLFPSFFDEPIDEEIEAIL